MSDNFLVDEPAAGVRRITINRPDATNAFQFEMYAELHELFRKIKYDPRVRVVILTAAGTKHFCTGHDLRAPGKPEWMPEGVGKPFFSRYSIDVIASLPVAMRNLPQPVICGVNGTVAGMALAFPLAADMTINEILVSGENNLTYDAGYFKPASIGDFVWDDRWTIGAVVTSDDDLTVLCRVMELGLDCGG